MTVPQSRDELDDMLRPVLSGLPSACELLHEAVTVSGTARRHPCNSLASRCESLDTARTRTLADVTRLPAEIRGDTIRVVQGTVGAQRQMLAVARVATHGPAGRLPDRSVRCSKSVVQLADRVVAVGLIGGASRPAGSSGIRLVRPLHDPADGNRRRLIRLPPGARGPVTARLGDVGAALHDLTAELDAMMGHLIIPVQWRFRPPADTPPIRQPAAAGAADWPPAVTSPSWGRPYELS